MSIFPFIDQSKFTKYWKLDDKNDRWQDIPIKRQNLDDKPSVDANEFRGRFLIHLEKLGIKNSGLILEDADSV